MSMPHVHPELPSAWVSRFSPLVADGGDVLDLACGGGRHARLFAARGCRVTAVDRDAGLLAALAAVPGIETLAADLENAPWPLAGRDFDGIAVTNYLHRPLFSHLLAALRPGGVLIYETFMLGNERFGRPGNPDFLLRPGELLEWLAPALTIVAFEQGQVERPKPAVLQRVCGIRAAAEAARLPSG